MAALQINFVVTVTFQINFIIVVIILQINFISRINFIQINLTVSYYCRVIKMIAITVVTIISINLN